MVYPWHFKSGYPLYRGSSENTTKQIEYVPDTVKQIKYVPDTEKHYNPILI